MPCETEKTRKKMNKKLMTLGAFATLLAAPNYLAAQEADEMAPKNSIDITAQIRPRFEYRNGAYLPLQDGDAPAILVNNRTRLNFEYNNADRLKVYVSLQNVNIWGQAPQIQATDKTGGMSVFEAYAAFPLAEQVNIKLGRQVIALDDDRIFGSLDWHPAGRSHDAVNINWAPNEDFTLRGFVAYNQTYAGNNAVNTSKGQYHDPAIGQDYQHLEALHAHYSIAPTQQLSFLFANLGYRNDQTAPNAKTQNIQTFGAHYTGKSDEVTYGATAYLQTGKNKSAYMFALNAGYRFSPIFALTAGLDYLSGNASDDTSGKDKAFNPFSGTNHKFYGFMDYYFVGKADNRTIFPAQGLLNPYLTANVRTGEKSNLSATYHFFAPAAKYQVGTKKHSSYGSEIDLVYSLKVQPFVGLQLGYSTYLVNEGTKVLKATPNPRAYQDWLWCSLNINPKIFSAKF